MVCLIIALLALTGEGDKGGSDTGSVRTEYTLHRAEGGGEYPRLYLLEPVVVKAEREPLFTAPWAVERIEKPDPAAETAEQLAGRAGVFFRSYGRLSGVSLRGGSVEQTQVRLSGAPVSPLSSGWYDASLLSPPLLKATELFRGGGSAFHGSGALGGGTGFVVGAPEGVGLWGGSFGSAGGFAGTGTGGRFGKAEVGLSWDRVGDYPYRDRFDKTHLRQNSHQTRTSFLVKGEGFGWDATALAALRQNGVPGPVGAPSPNDIQGDSLLLVALRGGMGWLEIATSATDYTLRYNSPARLSGFTRDRAYRVKVGAGRGWFTGGAEGGLQTVASSGYAPVSLFEGGLWGEVRVRAGPLGGQLALRGDSREGQATVPSASAAVSLSPLPGLLVYANGARSFRYPTTNELLWPDDGFAAGNPGLLPERGLSAELGLKAAIQQGGATIALFGSRTEDAIVWTPDNSGLWKPQNIARAAALGVEATAEGAFSTHTITLSGTIAKYRHYRPEEVNALYRPGGTLRVGVTLFSRVGLTYGWTGGRPSNLSGSRSLPSIHLFDLSLSLPLSLFHLPAKGELRGAALNVTNDSYQYVEGYPMPGRSFRVSLTLWR